MDAPDEVIRRHVLISGHVQGVGFRQSCRHQARLQSVNGWVENRPDGTVFAVFEGEAVAVSALIAWCRRGPASAQVRDVYVEDVAVLGDVESFEIIR